MNYSPENQHFIWEQKEISVGNFRTFINFIYFIPVFQTAESGEEAKMEPTCETQTEQPSSVMNQLDQLTLDQQPADELSTEQVLADQPPPQQGNSYNAAL